MRISRPGGSDDRRPRPVAGRTASQTATLFAALREAAGDRGWLPFSTYMDLALFHPEAGYYARLEAVGAAGDFATSPSLSPSFGKLFARQFHQIWRHMGHPSRFDLIELGPGAGQFAASVLAEVEQLPRFKRALCYGLVERSASLRTTQAKRLERWSKLTRWGETLAEVAPSGVNGVIVSNEFFDALPCHRLVQTREGLREIAVRVVGERLEEIVVPLGTERLAAELAAEGLALKLGQRIEISLASLDAMAEIGARLRQGAVITVDYGDVAREVYSPRRMGGSVRGFYRHLAVSDPYARPGEQDLTYDVNFTALARRGERAELATLGLLPQGDVLSNLGFDREIAELRRGKSRLEADQASAALEKLVHPQGMGGAFKVLFQGKGLGKADLAGLGGQPLPTFLWPWER